MPVDFLEKMNVTVSGAGDQTVVLGNGFGTTQAAWAQVLPWLEERFRVVRFDWPVTPRHFDHIRYSTLDAYAEDLLAVIEATQAAPCTLIGHSMSGMVGMLAGRMAPRAFTRMVMINPSPRYINDEGYTGGFSREQIAALISSLNENYLDWVRSFAPVVVGGQPEDPAVAEFAEGLLSLRPDVAMSMVITIFRSDLRDRLSGFTVPTTIIQSTADPAVPVGVAEYLCRHWPDCRVELLDMQGHLPHLTHAPLLVEALERILQSGDTAAATALRRA